LSNSFAELRALLKELIDEDMKLRSNFEFSVENKNLIKDLNFKKKIQMGLSILKNKGLVNNQIEDTIKKNLDLLS